VPDSRCTACHQSLEIDTNVAANNPRPKGGFHKEIRAFSSNHPEFRLVAERSPDPTPLKLNHEKHLRPDLPGPNGQRFQLQCADCHRIDDNGKILSVQFERDCQSCHSLAFDERIPHQAPHESADIVLGFVRTAFSRHAGDHPGQWKSDPDWHPARSIAALRIMRDEAPQSLPAWVEARVAASRRLLFNQRCRECHVVENPDSASPAVQSFTVPGQWFVHSEFSHKTHRVMDCVSCHAGARTSTNTSDLMLPAKATCLTCHNDSNDSITACSTCHRYHQPWDGRVKSPLRLEDLR
jgi:hypothetical protein